MGISARLRAGLLALFVGVLAVTAGQVRPAHAVGADADYGVLPVCQPTTSDDPAWSDAHLSTAGGIPPYLNLGLANNCAWQSYYLTHPVCVGTACSQGPTHYYRPFVAGSGFPDTVDAAGGDHQRIRVTFAGAQSDGFAPAVTWNGCFPGAPYGQQRAGCSSTLATTEGQLLFRFRSADGRFEDPWASSLGNADPGFRIQRTGTDCGPAATGCDYEIVFNRDVAGHLERTGDVQALLVFYPNTYIDNGNGQIVFHNFSVAVPLLVVQSDGTAGPPTATPTPAPTTPAPAPVVAPVIPVTGGGAATATTVPSPTPRPAVTCPALPKGASVATATNLLRRKHIRVGTVVAPKGYPHKVAHRRYVVSQYLLQTDVRVKVHGKWRTEHRYRPLRAGQALPTGAVVALKVVLAKA